MRLKAKINVQGTWTFTLLAYDAKTNLEEFQKKLDNGEYVIDFQNHVITHKGFQVAKILLNETALKYSNVEVKRD